MNGIAATILSFWLAAGAQPYQAEALVRMAHRESNCQADPPRRGTGHCLYQWTGARWHQLRRFAATAACPPLEKQLEFALAELRTPTYSCFWSASPAQVDATLRRTFGRGAQCR